MKSTISQKQKFFIRVFILIVLLCISALKTDYKVYSSISDEKSVPQSLSKSDLKWFKQWFKRKKHAPTPTPPPTPTPSISITPMPIHTPTPLPTPNPIPHGTKGFSVSGGPPVGPKMSHGSLIPYDPATGETQKIQIYVSDTQPIQSATVTIMTDNGQTIVPMSLISGTDISGMWEGAWIMQDSYFYSYRAIIDATSSNGTRSVNITLR